MRITHVLATTAAAMLVLTVGLSGVAQAGKPPLSEKRWRKAANSICREAGQDAQQVIDEAFGDLPADAQPSLEQITTYVAGIEPIRTELVDRIEALREPKSLEKKVRRFVKTARRDLERVVADPSIGLEGNPFAETLLRADALGVKACT